MNRIEPVIEDIRSERDLSERMELIMYALNDTVTPIPDEGTFCTFKYFCTLFCEALPCFSETFTGATLLVADAIRYGSFYLFSTSFPYCRDIKSSSSSFSTM